MEAFFCLNIERQVSLPRYSPFAADLLHDALALGLNVNAGVLMQSALNRAAPGGL